MTTENEKIQAAIEAYQNNKSTDGLLSLHKAFCSTSRSLMQRKNSDYKGGSEDPLHNFRMSELVKIDMIKGMLVRMQDKMARLVAFIEKGSLAVKEESIYDVGLDLINYTVLVMAAFAERLEVKKDMGTFQGLAPVVSEKKISESLLTNIENLVSENIDAPIKLETEEEAITALISALNYIKTK